MLLAAPAGERYELGLLMSALLLAQEGVDCVYLGPDLPLDELASAANATAARCVGLCLARSPQPDEMHAALQEMVSTLPCDCRIWLGGPGAKPLDPRRLPSECTVIDSGEHLLRSARELANA